MSFLHIVSLLVAYVLANNNSSLLMEYSTILQYSFRSPAQTYWFGLWSGSVVQFHTWKQAVDTLTILANPYMIVLRCT